MAQPVVGGFRRFRRFRRFRGSTVARHNVVGQRQERIPLLARSECGQAALGARGVLERGFVRELGAAMLVQQSEDVAPLFRATVRSRTTSRIRRSASAPPRRSRRMIGSVTLPSRRSPPTGFPSAAASAV